MSGGLPGRGEVLSRLPCLASTQAPTHFSHAIVYLGAWNRLESVAIHVTIYEVPTRDNKMADGTSCKLSNGCGGEFENWLSARLRTLGLDEDVFGSYVVGVLDSEDTDEERKDALIGILEGMTVILDLLTKSI